MSQAKRQRKCHTCPNPIDRFEAIVIGRTVRRAGTRVFTKERAWHVKCWVMQGLKYLEEHPHVPRLGRPRLTLTQDQRQARLKLLRRHAQLMFLYRACWEKGDVQAAVANYIRAYDLKAGLEELGGVPKTWELNIGSAVRGVGS